MKILCVIPARGGSKGIPYKNIKLLAGKPLICYSIDVARELTSDDNICVSTDDEQIIEVVEKYGLKVPFKRPAFLATDDATTNDVLLHSLDFYIRKGFEYEVLVLLQPTSPLRKISNIKEALDLYTSDIDMVVSVKKSKAPAVLCNDNNEGYLELYFNKEGLVRQRMKPFYEYNGAIYIINVTSLRQKGLSGFNKKQKYVMDDISSIDIDTFLDWQLAETAIDFIKNNKIASIKSNIY